jgi:hypothetical protein
MEPGPEYESFGCYVTIWNRTSKVLSNAQLTDEWGKYTERPFTNLEATQWTWLTLLGRSGSPSGSEGTCQYDVGEVGFGTVLFKYSCPYSGDNTASTENNGVEVKLSVYAQQGTRQRIGVGAGGFWWATDESNWGQEGIVPIAGHPIAILFVVDTKKEG